MNYSKWLGVVFLNCVIAISHAHAKDLGKHGEVYKIEEENILDAIYAKLKGMEASGELAKKKKEIQERSMHKAKNPKAVDGIVTAREKRVFYYDPTIVLSENITTDDGKIIAPSGTKVNPFDTMALTRSLVFFDGRDPEQVKAVEGLLKVYDRKITPILTAGSWYDLTKKFRRQVYFDQYGYITTRLGIRAVPSLARQKGKQLEITEMPATELKP